jgi:hypothetical protein
MGSLRAKRTWIVVEARLRHTGEAVTPIVPVPDEQPLVLAFTLPDQALAVALVHEASIGMQRSSADLRIRDKASARECASDKTSKAFK